MNNALCVNVRKTLEDLPAPRPSSLLVNLCSQMRFSVEDVSQVCAAVLHLNMKPRDGDGLVQSSCRKRGRDCCACSRRAGRLCCFCCGPATAAPCSSPI